MIVIFFIILTVVTITILHAIMIATIINVINVINVVVLEINFLGIVDYYWHYFIAITIIVIDNVATAHIS